MILGMKQHRDSQKPIALIQRYSEGSVAPEEIQVVPTGTWDHPAYGEMEIDSAAIRQFVQNFKDKVRLKIPITAGHDTGMGGGEYGELPAIGWFTELVDRGVNGLWGAVDWTDKGKELIAQGAFKYFSPEFYETYTDPETQTKYEHVLVGGALTNKPYFKELEPVAFAFSEPSIMNQYNNQSMSKDTEKKFDEEVKTEETKVEETKEEATVEDAKSEEVKEETKVEASETGEKISAAELKILRDQADKGSKAFAELEGMKADKKAEKLLFSVTNAEGRFLPKQEVALKSFVRSLSESQRDQFATLITALPAMNFSSKEIGDGGKTDTGIAGIAAEVDTAVKAKMSELKINYSDALRKVFKENPNLQKRYNEEMSAGE